MIDEKFGEIFFLAKDEFDIESKTPEEQKLWDMLEKFKEKLKRKCKYHFEPEPSEQADYDVDGDVGIQKRMKDYKDRLNFFNDTKEN